MAEAPGDAENVTFNKHCARGGVIAVERRNGPGSLFHYGADYKQ
jgi:hypothetical protein